MPYNNVIDRSGAAALMPEEAQREIWQAAIQQSGALSLFPHVTMGRKQQRIPVMSVLPVAYFVNGDTGLKQTSEADWANKYLDAEELAVIVPIPEAVLDDSDYDIWAEVKPRVAEAIGQTVDAAVYFGTNKPAVWPTDIAASAAAAGNTFTRATTAANGGIGEDLNRVMDLVETDGYDVNGFFTRRNFRRFLRGGRDSTGQKYLDISPTEIDGNPVHYGQRGIWPSGSGAVEMFAGDWSQGMMGIRQDITMKLFTEGVITDDTGAVIYNLMQQDMVALRVVFRCAWQIPNPINLEQPVEANRYPFATLLTP